MVLQRIPNPKIEVRFLVCLPIILFLCLLPSALLAADTLIKTGCSKDYPGVQWFIYEDANGNRYSTKDPKSRKCGFRRYLNLSMEKEYGDRFDPAIVNVDYKDMLGREEGWGMVHHKTTMGHAEREGCCTVKIYGDGRTGDGIFTLGREEIQFRIETEPTCLTESKVDCQGYTQTSSQNFIYYGEDDETVVTWELGILVYASHAEYGDDVPLQILEEWDQTHPTWKVYEDKVEKYNQIYAHSGVHVEYKLTRLYLAHWHSLFQLAQLVNGLPVDITLGRDTSYPNTCGVADVTTVFIPGQPPTSMSRCDVFTDLHELGHSVGLAHGPENQSWQASGYIFPEFGHGWNNICGRYDDLMSYGRDGVFHSNSLLACFEVTRDQQTRSAGDRQWSDTAYSINRVRFDVSLIHDPYKYVGKPQRLSIKRTTTEVID